MFASIAASVALAVSTHHGYSGGTCVDVQVNGKTVADAICPPRNDLAVRTFSAAGHTIYFGAIRHRVPRVELTFATRVVRTRVTADRAYAVAAGRVLGAITVGRRSRDVDPFGLPPVGRRVRLQRLTDESGRRLRLVAAAPRVLSGKRRRKALCTGLKLATAPSPGRAVCAVNPLKLDVRFSAECNKRKQLVFGIGPAVIRKAVATLSDGSKAPVRVTRIPRAVKRPGVALTARFSGAMATKVRTYDAAGSEAATAVLAGGCANTRSKIR
ncbi:MAG: hypothetical protein QOI80_2959 [Solirubrobacteraceae bacterium]|nr:hypothetical protein [Solirubrobacteraceae bacterium]